MKINKELQKGSTSILILSLLQHRSMYGYEMIRELERQSEGVFALKEGTLYPILHALEADGQVEAYWDAASGGRKRRYYAITKQGQASLQHRKEEWSVFKLAVDRVVGEGGL